MNRREFLQVSGAAVGAGALPGTIPAPAVSELRTISQQPEFYHGWPTLARRRNGDLVLVCSGGREAHVCPFGRVEYMTSRDGGQTWTWPRVVLDGPIDDRDAGVLETSRGTLLVTSFSSLAYQGTLKRLSGERRRRWDAAHQRATEAERKQALGVWMTRSTDGGLTWSRRQSPIVNSPHGPIELGDGRLFYAGKRLWADDRPGFAVSADDGVTWKWLADLPVRDGDRPGDYHELHAVQAKDGRIVVQIRNHNKANARETLQCHSTDGGGTWSTPRSIGVWGLPSHLLRLADGRLLMSYGHRRKPFGNQARVSEDHGATWSAPIVISDDGAGGDLGYPSTVQVADGSLVTVWYEAMQGARRAVLRQARWSLPGG